MFKNHAVIVQKPGEVHVQEASIPRLRDDYIIVKTKAVALNPTDWKHVDFLTSKGARASLLVLQGAICPLNVLSFTWLT
jgi:NADPH:quinone reductase-like Zn-dependent oxidoreductase